MVIWVAVLPRVDQLTEAMPNFWRAVYIIGSANRFSPVPCQAITRTSTENENWITLQQFPERN